MDRLIAAGSLVEIPRRPSSGLLVTVQVTAVALACYGTGFLIGFLTYG